MPRQNSRSRSRSRHRRQRISTPALVRELLAHRVTTVTDPTAGAPTVDYAANPWTPYAELVDVFTPPPLDADGNPIKPEQKEWREDSRTLKGWTEPGTAGSAASGASVEKEFKL